ncbi:aminoglycoside phosphotransferase [Beutenbergia cavernae DSM 12333]|uniref:Aminoglycoside phosphotransferase n=1 Tax=Beutenbergia cavernae (strain ATCC BAA-8 / DSM 12333 / CCUG 43141 / JCM 11478 / NBRC 16432 / NCIMB 13614 / HKI 0122) TaxID=471853 RepID=C5BY66_BEUC1|nr:phosphotransferase [Beutenbergia cavernae]ACQ80966.1 aminoglycoside phosphotransferase [Beutenbergia cavernae DSM 12333]
MDVPGLLRTRWGVEVDAVEPLDLGMNSLTWRIRSGGRAFVAKAVGLSDGAFGAGLELARRLDAGGLITGAPVPSLGGRLVERVGEQQLAVLRYVDGTPLAGGPEDQSEIGATLARVHELAPAPAGDLVRWLEVVTQFDDHLDLEPWIRPAVQAGLDDVVHLTSRRPLTWASLHGDPAPEAFLRQADGTVALIDWGAAMVGPVLYDVASAVMYAGAPEHVVAAYLAGAGPGRAAEVAEGLHTFRRLRWCVQAAYFAWRCTMDVRTGAPDPGANATGLEDARRALATADAGSALE